MILVFFIPAVTALVMVAILMHLVNYVSFFIIIYSYNFIAYFNIVYISIWYVIVYCIY